VKPTELTGNQNMKKNRLSSLFLCLTYKEGRCITNFTMFARTVRQIGSSLGVNLPRKYLEKLGIQKGDIVMVSIINKAIYLEKFEQERFGKQGNIHRPDR
jgi:bifunctional DNA-binding transcriptional regulator/antitoxin component of YhaV-PrlF toxin-antitoxin module